VVDISKFLVKYNENIISAMKIINENSKGIVFVEDKNKKIIASLTDGDIRRYILSGKSLKRTVSEVANYNYTYINEGQIKNYKKIMENKKIFCVPVLDSEKKLISVLFEKEGELISSKKLNTPVVVMAGGKGTRLKPYSYILPKPLIPIGKETITERILDRFSSFGCDKFFIIVNHKKELIKAYFKEIDKNYNINFIDETRALGTGGGLKLLSGIKETFFMTNCDILANFRYDKILEFHKRKKNIITMVCSAKEICVPYGTIILNELGEISELQEKPNLPFLTNVGFYVIEPEFLNYIKENEFVHVTDLTKRCIDSKEKVGIFPVSECSWYDIGQLDGLEELAEIYK